MVDANGCDIEIFGRPAGRLVANGDRFVFYAADQTFWELDWCSFNGLTEVEEAINQAWVRRMHRCARGWPSELVEFWPAPRKLRRSDRNSVVSRRGWTIGAAGVRHAVVGFNAETTVQPSV